MAVELRQRVRNCAHRTRLLGAACLIEVLVRTTPLSTTCRLLRVRLVLDGPVRPVLPGVLPGAARSRLSMVDTTIRVLPFRETCLRRALLTCIALRHVDPVLRLGWMPVPPPGNAHAWVQVGESSLEDGLDAVVPLRVTR